jgi:hypothetical protein
MERAHQAVEAPLFETFDASPIYIENPYTVPLWSKISGGLTAAGRDLGLDITSFAALPVRTSTVLQFFAQSNATLRQLSGQSWLRVTEGYEDHAERLIAFESHSALIGSRHHFIRARPLVVSGCLYEVKYAGNTLLLSLPWEEFTRSIVFNGINSLVLAATNREALLSVIDDYEDWRARREPSLRVWGGVALSQEPAQVDEDALILDRNLKKELLAYVDRFWRYKSMAEENGLSYRRGLLLAGRPGTGKTQFVRHLFSRFPDAKRHLFVPATGNHAQPDQFGMLIRALNMDRSPAIVVLEDIDQLFESRALTPQYLLNVLDGLLTLPQVILWVATTNDPTALALNLLDRPGRFDRVIVFPEPAAPERRLMLRAFSKRDLSEACLDASVPAAKGLSGAHLREVCETVALAVLDGSGSVLQRSYMCPGCASCRWRADDLVLPGVPGRRYSGGSSHG